MLVDGFNRARGASSPLPAPPAPRVSRSTSLAPSLAGTSAPRRSAWEAAADGRTRRAASSAGARPREKSVTSRLFVASGGEFWIGVIFGALLWWGVILLGTSVLLHSDDLAAPQSPWVALRARHSRVELPLIDAAIDVAARDIPIGGHSAMAWQHPPDDDVDGDFAAPGIGASLPGRSKHAQRFTDMTCFAHGDEAELCRYEHALCYDGERLVLSVPEPPGPRVGSNKLGHVMRELTANCYDFRFYDPEGAEVRAREACDAICPPTPPPLPCLRFQYTGCRYDSPRFHRMKSHLLTPKQLQEQPVNATNATWGNAFPDEPLEPLFASRDVKSDWAIPLTRRRWGPANRGQLLLREIHGAELFGPDPHDSPALPPCMECAPPAPPAFSGELRVSRVTQFGNTTATWLDGALWIMAVDADFAEHIYHFSTRILSLFTAQRHNRSHVRAIMRLDIIVGWH